MSLKRRKLFRLARGRHCEEDISAPAFKSHFLPPEDEKIENLICITSELSVRKGERSEDLHVDQLNGLQT